MKPLKFKHAAIVLALMLFGNINAQAAQDEYSRKIHKEYDVNDQTVLELTNKYGDVDITNWQKDKVSIDVTITVDHRKEEKARELSEYIHVEINQEGNKITATTDFDKRFNRTGGIFNFGEETKEFSIDYDIKIPSYLNLELANKYGDVFINEITGRADITVKYGNFKANKILRDNSKPLSHISLAYSNGNIKEVNWLKLTLKYTPNSCEIEKARALIAVTKYSKLYVNQASSVVSESKYDNYRLGHLTNFVCEAKYTDIKIKQVDKKIDLVSKYGDISISNVPVDFEKIKIDNQYGNVDIDIDESASYLLQGEANYADIGLPNSGKVNRIEKNTGMKVSGTIGNKENPKSEVMINTQYGNVNLE